MGDLLGMTIGAARDAAVTAADDAGSEILMAPRALQVEATVAAGGDHRRSQVIVAEGALSIDLIRRRRLTGPLGGAMIAARGEQRRETEHRECGCPPHRRTP